MGPALNISDAAFSGNTARRGGALALVPVQGGLPTARLVNCTFTANTAQVSHDGYTRGLAERNSHFALTRHAICRIQGSSVFKPYAFHLLNSILSHATLLAFTPATRRCCLAPQGQRRLPPWASRPCRSRSVATSTPSMARLWSWWEAPLAAALRPWASAAAAAVCTCNARARR